MVIITPEKVEPPPYTAVDPSPDSSHLLPPASGHQASQNTGTGSLKPPLPARRSFSGERPKSPGIPQNECDFKPLRVVKSREDIIGSFKIHSGSSVSPPDLRSISPPPKAVNEPDGLFETQKGKIDISIAWVTMKSGSSPSRAYIEASSLHGGVNIATSSRTSGLPVHIKATSHANGDVRICVPTDFNGVLSLRVSGSQPWRTRIGISPSLREQVVCTRETALAPKVKGKGKDRLHDDKSESTLVEFLIGSSLEAAALNRASDSGPGSLDLVEAESREGKIWVYAYEVEAMDERTNEIRASSDTKKSNPLFFGPGVSVSMERTESSGRPNLSTIAIVVEEPRWLESARRKWGIKLGGSNSSVSSSGTSIKSKQNENPKEKVNDFMQGLTSWLHAPRNPSANSVTSLVAAEPLSHSTPSTPSTTHSPLRSPKGSPCKDTHLHPMYSPGSTSSQKNSGTYASAAEQSSIQPRTPPPSIEMTPPTSNPYHSRSSSSPGAELSNSKRLIPPTHPSFRHPHSRSAENLTLLSPYPTSDFGRYPTPARKLSSPSKALDLQRSGDSRKSKRDGLERSAGPNWHPHWMVPTNAAEQSWHLQNDEPMVRSAPPPTSIRARSKPAMSSMSTRSSSTPTPSHTSDSSCHSRVLIKSRRGRSSSNPDARSPRDGTFPKSQQTVLTKPHR